MKKDGLHCLDQYLMIEIIDPYTREPVKDGAPGVAVYTTLWDKGFPLLRYWTDDLMVIRREKCRCGSSLPRLYYLGRLNDCYLICGSYVFPENVENILFKYGLIGEYHVEKHERGFLVKTEGNMQEPVPEMVRQFRDLFHADTKIEVVPPGSLNYDGHSKRFS